MMIEPGVGLSPSTARSSPGVRRKPKPASSKSSPRPSIESMMVKLKPPCEKSAFGSGSPESMIPPNIVSEVDSSALVNTIRPMPSLKSGMPSSLRSTIGSVPFSGTPRPSDCNSGRPYRSKKLTVVPAVPAKPIAAPKIRSSITSAKLPGGSSLLTLSKRNASLGPPVDSKRMVSNAGRGEPETSAGNWKRKVPMPSAGPPPPVRKLASSSRPSNDPTTSPRNKNETRVFSRSSPWVLPGAARKSIENARIERSSVRSSSLLRNEKLNCSPCCRRTSTSRASSSGSATPGGRTSLKSAVGVTLCRTNSNDSSKTVCEMIGALAAPTPSKFSSMTSSSSSSSGSSGESRYGTV